MDLLKALDDFFEDYYQSFSKLPVGGQGAGFKSLMQKSSIDWDMRRKLLQSPRQSLEKHGFKLPVGFHVECVQDTADLVHLPLLPFIGDVGQDKQNKPPEGRGDFSKGGRLTGIVQKASTDAEYRRRLLQQPEKVLRENFDIQENVRIKVIECTDNLYYLVLPPFTGTKKKKGELEYRIDREHSTIFLSGRLDADTLQLISPLLLDWQGDLRLDLAALRYISSAGLGLFITKMKKLIKSGHQMTVLNVCPEIRTIFTITGLDFMLYEE